jgi:hypothetical protein
MELFEALGKVAKNISDVDQDQIQQIINEGKTKTADWSSADKGLKGLYAKVHRGDYGFLFRLIIVLAVPFVIGFINKKLSRIYRTETEEEIIAKYLRDNDDNDEE